MCVVVVRYSQQAKAPGDSKMIELLLAALVGVLRRLDGIDKDDQSKVERFVINTSVRLIPVTVGAFALSFIWQPEPWYFYIIHIWFGGMISVSLQRGYDGWTRFSFRQITQHGLAMGAYVALAFLPPNVEIAVIGVVCCLLAGLSHPVLSRTRIVYYTYYAEFLTGFLLLLPFAIHQLL